MTPHVDLSQAIAQVQSASAALDALSVPIADSLNDPMGMNLAILVDAALGNGWEPDGFEQQPGYRVYHYKRLS